MLHLPSHGGLRESGEKFARKDGKVEGIDPTIEVKEGGAALAGLGCFGPMSKAAVTTQPEWFDGVAWAG
jgi:hypothetical protein